MSRELVLCILVAAYDEIQTAQFNDVAQFWNIESFSKSHFGKRGKSSLEELRACHRDHGARHIVEETVSPGSNHGLQSLTRLVAACSARAAWAACDGFGIARDTATTFDVFFWLQVTNFDVSLLHSVPSGPDHIDIKIFALFLHGQLFRGNVHYHDARLTR
ncbi:MAG TPA: hypothetical protein VIU10_02485 [Candidatus Udaeobacter sp.]